MRMDHVRAILAGLWEDDEDVVIVDTAETIPLAPREPLTPTAYEALCFALGALAAMHPLGDHSPLMGRPAVVGSQPSPMPGISGHGAGAMGHRRGVTPRTHHDRAYEG